MKVLCSRSLLRALLLIYKESLSSPCHHRVSKRGGRQVPTCSYESTNHAHSANNFSTALLSNIKPVEVRG